jgi:hypothetical protein
VWGYTEYSVWKCGINPHSSSRSTVKREIERERGGGRGRVMKKKIEDDATFCSYIDKHISLPVS